MVFLKNCCLMLFIKKAEVLTVFGKYQALCPGDDGGLRCAPSRRSAGLGSEALCLSVLPYSKTLLESFAEVYYSLFFLFQKRKKKKKNSRISTQSFPTRLSKKARSRTAVSNSSAFSMAEQRMGQG